MSKFTSKIVGFALCSIGMSFPLVNGVEELGTTESSQQKWAKQYRNNVSDSLLWNEEKTLAVSFFNEGADSYHYFYWCFRLTEQGGMEPFACFSTQSRFLYPSSVEIVDDGIIVTLRGLSTTMTHKFLFADTPYEIVVDKAESGDIKSLPRYPEIIDSLKQ